MAEEPASAGSGSNYWMGLLVGLGVGAGLFWVTMKILVALR